MDPAATLIEALNALKDNNLNDARNALDNYASWRNSGGYSPRFSGPRDRQTFAGDDLCEVLNDALTLALAVKDAA